MFGVGSGASVIGEEVGCGARTFEIALLVLARSAICSRRHVVTTPPAVITAITTARANRYARVSTK